MSGLTTLRDYIRWAMSQFSQAQLYFENGSESAFEEARSLVLRSLHLPYELHDKYLDCHVHTDEHAVLQGVLKQRIEQRLPTAYVLGEAWFAGMLLKIDQRVMVPRSPLDELISQQFEPWLSKMPLRILDLCAGSGCLGIACAHEFPEAEVLLTDISQAALAIADENIALQQLSERVQTLHSDMFAQLTAQRFDLIVCKPPYISAEQWSQLPLEYQHEPKQGSIAAEQGLEFIQQVIQQAGEYLAEDGLLVLEVGPHQAQLIAQYPDIDFTWLEHSHTGNGVLALTAQQCVAY